MSQTLAWLDAALKAQDARPLWTLDDVVADIKAGRARLWQGDKSCVVTVETDFPSAGERLIEAWLAAGDLGEIRREIAHLEEYARSAGCTQAHITGRKGWVRELAPRGYEHYATTVRKLLTP